MTSDFILAIDQGTTSSRVLVFSADGRIAGRGSRELPQYFPQPGWVEHAPGEIWETVAAAIKLALDDAGVSGASIAAIGITNQRETAVLWDRETGEPLCRAIVWQDRRTTDVCASLIRSGRQSEIQLMTGLVVDPYFSATKVQWMLNHVGGARSRAERGEVCFGTVESFLVYRLSGGMRRDAPHVTDVTNASRTLLMDLESRCWSPAMLELFEVPASVLPRIVTCAETVARTRDVEGLPDGIPISGLAGDQHAALFGQGCFAPGDTKCTYGTGAFVLVNTGTAPVRSRYRLLSTMAWQLGSEATYAMEGSCFVAGAAIQWLRDGLGLLRTAAESESLARQADSTDGVVFVPALAGLGAPHWDPDARGLLMGLTRGTRPSHIARAALEGIAFQVDDILEAMRSDLGRPLTRFRVDGGAAGNDLLMQLQSDTSAIAVERPREIESTARGAAMLAGLGVGLYSDPMDAAQMIGIEKSFMVRMGDGERVSRQRLWQDAVRRARTPADRHDAGA